MPGDGDSRGAAVQANRIYISLAAFGLALLLYGVGVFAQEKLRSQAGAVSTLPFAVIELFTSEGCSSCPPADRLLGEIAEEARKKGKRIFSLAFHVDYWDRLGWRDRFSDSAYSRRQRAYARAFDTSDGVYTPQMIVNGVEAFVGSNRERAHRSIERALRRPARVGLAVQSGRDEGSGSVVVEYEVSRATGKAVLHVALVESGLVSDVVRGENAGRRLSHDQVVRVFETVRLKGSGKGRVELKAPETVVSENMSIVAYVQDPKTMAVLGAAHVTP